MDWHNSDFSKETDKKNYCHFIGIVGLIGFSLSEMPTKIRRVENAEGRF